MMQQMGQVPGGGMNMAMPGMMERFRAMMAQNASQGAQQQFASASAMPGGQNLGMQMVGRQGMRPEIASALIQGLQQRMGGGGMTDFNQGQQQIGEVQQFQPQQGMQQMQWPNPQQGMQALPMQSMPQPQYGNHPMGEMIRGMLSQGRQQPQGQPNLQMQGIQQFNPSQGQKPPGMPQMPSYVPQQGQG